MFQNGHYYEVFDEVTLQRYFKNILTPAALDQFIHGSRKVLGIGKPTETYTLRVGGRESKLAYSKDDDLLYSARDEYIIYRVTESHYRQGEGTPYQTPRRTFKSAHVIEEMVDDVLDNESHRPIANDGYPRHKTSGLHWYVECNAYVVINVKKMREANVNNLTLPVRHIEIGIDECQFDNSQSRYNERIAAYKDAVKGIVCDGDKLHLTVSDGKITNIKSKVTWHGVRYLVISDQPPTAYFYLNERGEVRELRSIQSNSGINLMARIEHFDDKGQLVTTCHQASLEELRHVTYEEAHLMRRDVGIFESHGEAQGVLPEKRKATLENDMIESKLSETYSKAEVNTTKASTEVMKEYRGLIGAVIGASVSAAIAIGRFLFATSSKCAIMSTPVGVIASVAGVALYATSRVVKPIARWADRTIKQPIKRAVNRVKSFFSSAMSLFS